ncbi:MAG: KH domain-containing protein [Candidatus Bathyarchaeota archaeon]|nr:KH domain-containing protein [Candidatus Bathyarchaeota archaeon]MDH5733901.1 KH domain-containing protein [Candidatus Bathyarchaeota archaeon]
MQRSSTFVKIPQERIGALIGPEGQVKATIEKKLSVELEVESETGGITITLLPTASDPTVLFRAKEIVIAIGRGFSPERAFRLLHDDESFLEIIDLREIVGRSQSDIKRLKGRVIGKGGKTRGLIEELTEVGLSVYGHTISIIGNTDQAEAAKEAVRMLIRGSQHSTVYRFLHRKRREFKKKKMELWETKPPS